MAITELVFRLAVCLVTMCHVLGTDSAIQFVFSEEAIWQTITKISPCDAVRAVRAGVLRALMLAILFITAITAVLNLIAKRDIADTFTIVTQETSTLVCAVELIRAVRTFHAAVADRRVAYADAILAAELITVTLTFVTCAVQQTILAKTLLAVDSDVAAWGHNHLAAVVHTGALLLWDADGFLHVLQV